MFLPDPLSTPLLSSTTALSPVSSTVFLGFSPSPPLSVTFNPAGSKNRGRPITVSVPVTLRPPRQPPGRTPMCEERVSRGVQWPQTPRGENVQRPCPKGSLGKCVCVRGTHLSTESKRNSVPIGQIYYGEQSKYTVYHNTVKMSRKCQKARQTCRTCIQYKSKPGIGVGCERIQRILYSKSSY